MGLTSVQWRLGPCWLQDSNLEGFEPAAILPTILPVPHVKEKSELSGPEFRYTLSLDFDAQEVAPAQCLPGCASRQETP